MQGKCIVLHLNSAPRGWPANYSQWAVLVFLLDVYKCDAIRWQCFPSLVRTKSAFSLKSPNLFKHFDFNVNSFAVLLLHHMQSCETTKLCLSSDRASFFKTCRSLKESGQIYKQKWVKSALSYPVWECSLSDNSDWIHWRPPSISKMHSEIGNRLIEQTNWNGI